MGGRRQSLILQPDWGYVVGVRSNILWLLISELPHHPFQLESFSITLHCQRCKNSQSLCFLGPCLLDTGSPGYVSISGLGGQSISGPLLLAQFISGPVLQGSDRQTPELRKDPCGLQDLN